MITVTARYESVVSADEFNDIKLKNYEYHHRKTIPFNYFTNKTNGEIVVDIKEIEAATLELREFLVYKAEEGLLDLCEDWVSSNGNSGNEPNIVSNKTKK